MKRVIVAHIGSTKFHTTFDRMNFEDTLAGKIVLTVGCATQPDSNLFANLTEEEARKTKRDLDQLHLEKIDLADEILVINVGGYLKNSTLHELCYAHNTGKHIRWLEENHLMYCSLCQETGPEKDHFFHAALDLEELDDILSRDEEGATQLIGPSPTYDAIKIADWHGSLAPIVRLDTGSIALQVDLTCTHCQKKHETHFAISGCHRGAYCYVADKEGTFLADLRNQEFVCAECQQASESKEILANTQKAQELHGKEPKIMTPPIPMCNHTSVGAIIQHEGKLLLIERQQFPWGFACPAGHVEEDEAYADAIVREVKEETGLTATDVRLAIDCPVKNQCRRPGGEWHHWRVYSVDTLGDLIHNEDEVKRIGWYRSDEVQALVSRTEEYCAGLITEDEWKAKPGLEPVWYDFLLLAHIL